MQLGRRRRAREEAHAQERERMKISSLFWGDSAAYLENKGGGEGRTKLTPLKGV